jgi:DNA mismatch endonuclease, patch repair protein
MNCQERSFDIYDPKKRSSIMSKVRSKNTKPEIIIRRRLFALGYRYRLNVVNLPGKPDIVLPKYRTVILIHGCFWHQHPGCKKATIPKTNSDFWRQKLLRNVERDRVITEELKSAGWQVIILWECEIKKDQNKIANDIDNQLRLFLYK